MTRLALLLLLLAAPAHAATWIELQWTAPDSVAAYRATSTCLDGTRTLNLYRAPSPDSAGVRPVPAGQTARAWVPVTTDPWSPCGWRNGGQGIRIYYDHQDGGRSPGSNLLVYACALADTNYLDTGVGIYQDTVWDSTRRVVLDGKCWRRPWPNRMKPELLELGFARTGADTIMYASPYWPWLNGVGPLVHQEDVLRRDPKGPWAP